MTHRIKEKFHSDSDYNSPDDTRDRKNAETEAKGGRAYLSEEDFVDDDAEAKIYEATENALAEAREKLEEDKNPDKFGYISLIEKISNEIPEKELSRFVEKTMPFLAVHKKIVDSQEFNDEEKDKLLSDSFQRIFGHQIISRNPKTGKEEISLHKYKFKKVKQGVPSGKVYRPTYDARGRAIDPNAPVIEKKFSNKKTKSGIFSSGLKWNFKK